MYDAVLNELEMYMIDNKKDAPKPILVNNYYAVCLDKCWLRAQVTEVLDPANGEEEMVDVLLIDNGDIDTVPVSSLYVLEQTFTFLAAQVRPETPLYQKLVLCTKRRVPFKAKISDWTHTVSTRFMLTAKIGISIS